MFYTWSAVFWAYLQLSKQLWKWHYDFPSPLNGQFNEKVNHYNRKKQINLSMGQSVKLVLAIIDSISNKKSANRAVPCQPCRPVGGAKFWARAILAPRPKYLGQRYTILQNFRPFGYDIFKIPTRQNQMWSWLRPKYLGRWYTCLQTFRPFGGFS